MEVSSDLEVHLSGVAGRIWIARRKRARARCQGPEPACASAGNPVAAQQASGAGAAPGGGASDVSGPAWQGTGAPAAGM
eukprot:10964550-Lingulodinium_polyedra.AAC.1